VVDSVVMAGSRIAEGAVVRASILGRGVHVGANSVLDNVVLGDKSVVTDFSRLG